jgi:pSer/pThr/pTyr-binding forkhead associated (FHA) protein
MRGLYFIEHSLADPQAEDLYAAIQESLSPVGLQRYETNAASNPSVSLMDACQKIYLSTIGIFDLSAPNPDIYTQTGISAGLNKPALMIAGQGMTSAIPPVLGRAQAWFYTPPLKAAKELQRAVMRPLNKLAQARDDNIQTYCAFCGSPCGASRKQTHGKGFLILDGTHPQWQKLRDTIRTALKPTGLTPIYLSQITGRVMPLLCETRLAVLASEFVLLDLSVPCDPEQYIALGMAVSLRRPWLLITSQPQKLPPLLKKVTSLEYHCETDLQRDLETHVMKSLYPTRFVSNQIVTAQLEFPLWRQLDDWIARFEVHTSQALEGTLQLLLIEEDRLKQRCRMTPNMLIKAGRDPECDLLLETRGASRFHADFSLTEQGLMVCDLGSTNGTFVNGNPIPARQEVALQVGDRVRIGPAEVVVWNEDKLPQEVKRYLPESGRLVAQTIFVNLADGLVLVNGKIPVARLSASETNVLAFMNKRGSDTTTTSQIAEIIYGTGQVSRMIVASFIDSLRAKIEPSPSNPRFLVAVPGIGYRLRTWGGQLILDPG